jgi:hypothetical protein
MNRHFLTFSPRRREDFSAPELLDIDALNRAFSVKFGFRFRFREPDDAMPREGVKQFYVTSPLKNGVVHFSTSPSAERRSARKRKITPARRGYFGIASMRSRSPLNISTGC